MLALVVVVLVPPAGALITQQRELDDLREQRSATTAELAELTQRAERLRSPAQVETDARTRLHWVGEDELLYVVEDPAAGEPAAADDDEGDG